MEYIIQYDNGEYLINLKELSKKTKTANVFRYYYSNADNDWVDYEIQVFIRENDELKEIKLYEYPEKLKEDLGKAMKDELQRSFVANPYFDELLIFGSEVFTYQEQLIQVKCDLCQKANLYEKRNKGNKTTYISEVLKLLEAEKNPEWPFKEKLLLQFSVSMTQSKLNSIDLDNLAKTIFDTFKGVIYEDDIQIVSFAGDKNNAMDIKAFIVAIKRLENNERPILQDYLFSGKMNSWQQEREQKLLLNKPTRFRTYGTFKR